MWWRRLGLAASSVGPIVLGRPASLAVASVPKEAAGKTLVVVAVPDPFFMCSQITLMLVSQDLPRPERVRCLAGVEGKAEVRREDDHTLVVHTHDGLLSGYFVPLMRAPDDPIPEEWSLQLSDVRFEVAERDDAGAPLAIRAQFTTLLEDEGIMFVVWSPEERRLVPFVLPAVGETVSIRGQPMTALMTGG